MNKQVLFSILFVFKLLFMSIFLPALRVAGDSVLRLEGCIVFPSMLPSLFDTRERVENKELLFF